MRIGHVIVSVTLAPGPLNSLGEVIVNDEHEPGRYSSSRVGQID